MNIVCMISRFFSVAAIIFIGNACAMQQSGQLDLNFMVNDLPYGRIIATTAVGDHLRKKQTSPYAVIAAEAASSAIGRTGSVILAHKKNDRDVNYSVQAQRLVIHFGVDGVLRVIEDYAAQYGVSSKTIVTKSKEYLPEVIADGIEVVAPVVGNVVHASVSELLTGVVVVQAGCNK